MTKKKEMTAKEQEKACKAICKIINASMKTFKELALAFGMLAKRTKEVEVNEYGQKK